MVPQTQLFTLLIFHNIFLKSGLAQKIMSVMQKFMSEKQNNMSMKLIHSWLLSIKDKKIQRHSIIQSLGTYNIEISFIN